MAEELAEKMINFQLTTDKDRREAAAIEARRSREEERKKRIFNPRQRIFGVRHYKIRSHQPLTDLLE